MAEEYAEKMARKTDAELRQYVTGRDQYRDDAVLAAFDELTRRGQPHPDEAQVRPGLEAVVREQVAREAAARQLAEQDELGATVTAAPVPELYSQSTIAIFSMLPMSMMIGGGVLLGMNLFRLGRKRALAGLILFILVYVRLGSEVMTWAIMQQGLNPFLATLLFNIPAVLAYLFWFWPRYVHTNTYRSRGIILPMLVCFMVYFALIWGLQKAMPYLIKQQPKNVQVEMERLMKQ
jgi:lipopolysaccharide export LptBFGC system permease protein LptF